MWAFLIPLLEKLAVAVAPSVLSWVGDEALAVITGRVNAENATRAAEAAPRTDAAVDARLKDHSI
jgi:hypothetical protein